MYNILISLYQFLFRIVALFHHKAAKMVQGHKEVIPLLQKEMDIKYPYIWFHAASLGEFEQGRPLIERIREEYPQYRILLTFYSPSGYEVRKNYAGAHLVCYLPFDTPKNVTAFLSAARPSMAIFIKYEFWKNYLKGLREFQVPTYIVSAIFRPEQMFFKNYGKWYRNLLSYFDHLFVQDERSKQLLRMIGLRNVTVSGDTRFDRVYENKLQAMDIPVVAEFLKEKREDEYTIVAGSTWPKDEDFLINYVNHRPNIRLIIAPHQTHSEHIQSILSKLKRPAICYSEADRQNLTQASCLVIDCIGLLSSIYKYGDLTYVGGGFGVGIHNILEPAVFGIPVIFGPKHEKFREANALTAARGGFPIFSCAEFAPMADGFFSDIQILKNSGSRAGKFVRENIGSTDKIMKILDL